MKLFLAIISLFLLGCEPKPGPSCAGQFDKNPKARARFDEATQLYNSFKVTDKVIITEDPYVGLEGEIVALSKPQGSCYNGLTVIYPRATVYVPYLEKIGQQAQWLDLRELKKK